MHVMTRGADRPIDDQLKAISENPPLILVATPQALFEALKVEHPPLVLRELATVVVDEADYMLESIPRGDKFAIKKYFRMVRKHPTPTRQILDIIFRVVRLEEWRSNKTKKAREEGVEHNLLKTTTHGLLKTNLPFMRPQLILASATLKAQFRNSVLTDGKWLTSRNEGLVRVITHPKSEDMATSTFGSWAITHSALVCSWDGTVKNIRGAVDASAKAAACAASEAATSTALAADSAETDVAQEPSRQQEEDPSRLKVKSKGTFNRLLHFKAVLNARQSLNSLRCYGSRLPCDVSGSYSYHLRARGPSRCIAGHGRYCVCRSTRRRVA